MEFEFVEVCPHCGYVNEWSTNSETFAESCAYTEKCGNCGRKIMLCDACQHADDNEERMCDWNSRTNCFRNPNMIKRRRIRNGR